MVRIHGFFAKFHLENPNGLSHLVMNFWPWIWCKALPVSKPHFVRRWCALYLHTEIRLGITILGFCLHNLALSKYLTFCVSQMLHFSCLRFAYEVQMLTLFVYVYRSAYCKRTTPQTTLDLGGTIPKPKLSMFCALSQNITTFLEK